MFRKTLLSTITLVIVAGTTATGFTTAASAGGYGYGNGDHYNGGYQWYQPRATARKQAYRGNDPHLRWCYDRYVSYREYDNTFRPYHGPRKPCVSPFAVSERHVDGIRDQFGNLPEQPPETVAGATAEDVFRDQFGNLPEERPRETVGNVPADNVRDDFGNLPEEAPQADAGAAPEALPEATDEQAEAGDIPDGKRQANASGASGGKDVQTEAGQPEVADAPERTPTDGR